MANNNSRNHKISQSLASRQFESIKICSTDIWVQGTCHKPRSYSCRHFKYREDTGNEVEGATFQLLDEFWKLSKKDGCHFNQKICGKVGEFNGFFVRVGVKKKKRKTNNEYERKRNICMVFLKHRVNYSPV